MHKELVRLIRIAGAALEAEDRFILGAVLANQTAYPGGMGGILRFENERYYQFVVARTLTSSFPFAAFPELDSHDLVLKYPNNDSRSFAVVEMKRWGSPGGEQEIASIVSDKNKLRSCKAEHAFLMIFSANPRGKTDTNMAWLSCRLGISQTEDRSLWESYAFPTLNKWGDQVEFWVAGCEVPDTALNTDTITRAG